MRDGAVRIAVSALLAIACLLLYAPTLDYGFVFDDREIVVENAVLLRGLSLDHLVWAFATDYGKTWQPTTWISLLADVTLFGVGARGFHLTNLLLHAANTVLVFWLVLAIARRDRSRLLVGAGATLAAAFTAALFAFHPQAVEPVAWITSRKDVLSSLCFLLAVLAYLRFVETGRRLFWGGVLVAFAVGLMAKSMIVTLPLVLLLLDLWPLERFAPGDLASAAGRRRILPLVREKLPLFVLAALATLITSLVQSAAVASTDVLPVTVRLANVFSSLLDYVEKAVVPAGLSVAYPYSAARLRPERVLAGLFLLSALSYGALRLARTAPWLTVGWLWFLATLLPVIGLVPVGSHAMADRYTYLSHLGLWIGLSWGLAALARRGPRLRAAILTLGVAIVAGCLLGARQALPTWQDELTLFSAAVRSTPDSYVARYNLGVALASADRKDEAIEQYRVALGLHPDYLEARTNLAALLAERGRAKEAETEYAYVADHAAEKGSAYFNLARHRMMTGRPEAAEETALEGIALAPDSVPLLNLLGALRLRSGRPAEAIAPLEQALALDAGLLEVVNNLGVALRQDGRPAEAVRVLERGVRQRPDSVPLLLNLGLAYAAEGRHREALQAYRRAGRLAPRSAEIAAAQAASHAALGQQESALEAWQRAVRDAPADPESRLQLGLALLARGDRPGAEDQLAELERLDGGRAATLRRALREE